MAWLTTLYRRRGVIKNLAVGICFISTVYLLTNLVKDLLLWKPLKVFPQGNKLILVWNPTDDHSFSLDDCEYQNCNLTFDRRHFRQSDAVIFHSPRLKLEKLLLKEIFRGDFVYKKPGQVWVYLNYEPPSRTYTHFDSKWRNTFNWTWSYRRDSDISIPYNLIVTNKRIAKFNKTGIFSRKSKLATWYVSRCKTKSKRDQYVTVLQKYAHVDIYGQCGPLKCKYDAAECYKMLDIDYKFYLAFENSLCVDYITEKVYGYIQQNIVLVVRGTPNTDLFIPPSAYIDTRKFTTVKDLALYLKSLSKDKKHYEKYFEWKKHYTVEPRGSLGLCKICEKLQNPKKHQKWYEDIDKWLTTYNGQHVCNDDPNDFKE